MVCIGQSYSCFNLQRLGYPKPCLKLTLNQLKISLVYLCGYGGYQTSMG